MMDFAGTGVVAATPPLRVPVAGTADYFPVHRIYCMVRNHRDHAQEMGYSGLEDPFFFLKPADPDAVLVVPSGQVGALQFASLTAQLNYEIELVVAIGKGGKNIDIARAAEHIYGYAVGLDMTRQDLVNEMTRKGRPWCVGKAFDHSAVIGAITPAAAVPEILRAEILLQLNGELRQHSAVSRLIWDPAKMIEQLSLAWELRPGDLLYTGTPKGVGPVQPGDQLVGEIRGLGELHAVVVGP